MVAVVDLFVQCSYQVRNFREPSLCASDCCRAPADTVVRVPNGALMYRCPGHRGQCWEGQTGDVLFEVPRMSGG